MQGLDDKDILFITTSRFTPWLEWTKKSVKKFFPNSEHLIIDGTQNWPTVWFEWLNHLKNYNTKYFVMIDEDAFVLQRDGIVQALLEMTNRNATLAGVPDCYFVWRGFNEVAMNPFFLMGDRSKVLQALSSVPNWHRLRFNAKYFEKAKYDWHVKDRQSIATEYEPFYCFFYAILEANHSFYYLFPYDDYGFANEQHRLPATCVRMTPETSNLALHMWYSRQWNDAQNASRYQKLEKYLKTFL
jgi:hypothetical protein